MIFKQKRNKQPPSRVQVMGTGFAEISRIISNNELGKMFATSDEWIVTRTGIKERRIVDESITTADIALEASQKALVHAGISHDLLDLIIVATVTPNMLTPSTACLLQSQPGALSAPAFDISAGRTGFVYGVVTAGNFLRHSNYRYALVVGAETLSKFTDWTDRNTNVIFADGTGAMVLGKGSGDEGILASYLGADDRGYDLITIPAGGSLMPASEKTLVDHMHCVKDEWPRSL